MVIDLIQNVAVLIALSTLYSLVTRFRRAETSWVRAVPGVLFGAVAIAGMHLPFHYAPGIIFDGRSIVLALAGLFAAPANAAIAALMTALDRLQIGGTGALTGVGVITSSALIGMLYRRHLKGRPENAGVLSFFALGVLVHVAMLLWMLTLPWPTGLMVIRQLGLSVLGIFPCATVLMGLLLRTEERRILAERRLRESEERFRLAFDASPDAININRLRDGLYVDVNQGFTAITGFSRAETLGKTSPELQIWADPADRERLLRQLKENGTVDNLEAQFRMKDGRLVTGLMSARLITLNGELHILSATRDIEAIRQTEAELRQLNDELELRVAQRTAQLEDSNRELQAFAYSVSHDLRTPLRAIAGFAEIISRCHNHCLPDEARRYLQHILEAAERMEEMIEDLLRYSRLGRKVIPLGAVPLEPLLDEIVEEWEPQIKRLGAQIVVAPGLPTVMGAPTLLRQVFRNLIDNALKYCRDDPPRVTVEAEVDRDQVLIRVSDNGIGIAPDQQEKIFDLFQRLHPRPDYPGTGVGLAIVRKAVSLMGGSVSVVSTPGEGSEFRVRLVRMVTDP